MHAVALWVCVAACVFFARAARGRARGANGSDFAIYYRAGEAVLAGTDPMTVFGFIYLARVRGLDGASRGVAVHRRGVHVASAVARGDLVVRATLCAARHAER